MTAVAPQGQAGVKRGQCDTDILLSRARKEAERLSDEMQRLRGAFDTHVERISRELQTSQQEIERLARRVQRLEQQARPRMQIDTRGRLPTSPAKSLFTFLGRPSLPSLS